MRFVPRIIRNIEVQPNIN